MSRERYLQLAWFARQYDELKRREKAWRAGETERNGAGDVIYSGRPDPTASEGLRLANSPYAWKIAAIEQSAITAEHSLSTCLLANVTRGSRYEEMQVPCGRNQFFAARRRFFEELDARVP